ncbi:MAG: penicillin-binding protein 2 [Campylobacterota bacterium]|nr:penicillin-binding protein 2 [Campylobacterota bacterium]
MKIKFILTVFTLMWVIILVRVFYLAVESNSYYKNLSYSNTMKSVKIAPVRGEIVDRNNKPIAINKLGFKIQLRPHLLSKQNMAIFNEEIKTLINLLPSLDSKKLVKNYKKKDSYYNHNYIDIVEFISYEEIMPVYSVLNLRENIKIIPAPKRYYPYGSVGAHIIGYVSRANKKDIEKDKLLSLIGNTGKIGIEKYYDTYLQGKEGERKIKVNANNQEIEEFYYKKPIEDNKLVLNIDIELQKYISSLFKNKSGAVIVMDVNGSILSASSFPEYDLNIFVSGMSHAMYNKLANSLEHPFTNKLTHGLYPPGSSIKTGLGLIYITNIKRKYSVNCKSSYPLGKRVFRCWSKKGHGRVGITKAIRESCDDFFYKGGVKIGIKKMSEGLLRYGLGQKTGVDLPNEFIGIVPSRKWKKKRYNRYWYIGETANTSIGQGDFLVTPIQIANYTALMATGKLPTPYFVKQIGDKTIQANLKDILNAQELKKLPIIQRAMKQVCYHPEGTAFKHVKSCKIKIAGKTGTAQVIKIKQDIEKRRLEHELEYYNRSHAWFTTYGPYKNPQYIVSVIVEHGGHGGLAAGKMVSKIYNKLLELKYIK